MHENPVETLVAAFERTLSEGTFAKLALSKPRDGAADLTRVSARAVVIKGEPCVSLVYTHRTRDVTKNLPFGDAVAAVHGLIDTEFQHAHLFSAGDEWQLLISKKGKRTLRRVGTSADVATRAEHASAATAHDREKHRFLSLDRPFLEALGVTDAQHRLVPAMARKWKQINKFVEVIDGAFAASGLARRGAVSVADYGSGKGYLTFAMHDHLRGALGLDVVVTGVEQRPDMVALCNAAAGRLGLEGLHFEEGDVRDAAPDALDVMVALHACDTATDHAIHAGVRAGAAIIMCSPCCHKELRPQLLSPHPLRPILKHGVHLGQQAEMLTDGLRAMLLDACGYDTQVFEFVALEHTNKNKMILAVRRPAGRASTEVWKQIDDLKAFYGIRDQCLETLLKADREAMAA